MRGMLPVAAVLVAACFPFVLARSDADQPIVPLIELQSGPLTPGLVLDECPRPIHQVRIVVDAKLERGTLILDPNVPEFDEFGELTGGILTPQARGQAGPLKAVELACEIEPVREGRDEWRLYRLSGPKIRTALRVATRGSIADGGPARLVVYGSDKEVQAVVECTRYGLVVP